MNSNKQLSVFLTAFSDLFFPPVCSVCGTNLFSHETEICGMCLRKLPRTHFEKKPYDNIVSELMWGRCNIEKAFSLFFYRKGERVQHLLHDIKYRGNKKLGAELGRQLGKAIYRSDKIDFDIVVPIPLHPVKKHKRGFNQAEIIAKGLSEVLKVPVSNNIYRNTHTSTQTRKGRYERWENVKNIFSLQNPAQFDNKHLLLIDDVITTGSTLEACINTLNSVPGVKVSIATIAYASL